MTRSSRSSPSLNTFERYNDSRSIVPSSDTYISAGYTSLSGTTTSKDDTQTLYLGPMLQNVLADNLKHVPEETPSAFTRPRNFSSAMKKVMKAARALVAFKRTRPDDTSPILVSRSLRERFRKRLSVRRGPDKSFYNLPNRQLSLSDVIASSYEEPYGGTEIRDSSRKERGGPRMPSLPDSSNDDALVSPTEITEGWQAEPSALALAAIWIRLLRTLLFVLWCAAVVGGAPSLSPGHIEIVAFRATRYLPSPKGIRRSEHGQRYLAVLFACLMAVVWYNRALGLLVAAIVATGLAFVWSAFEVAWGIPLWEVDHLYHILKTGLAPGTVRSG